MIAHYFLCFKIIFLDVKFNISYYIQQFIIYIISIFLHTHISNIMFNFKIKALLFSYLYDTKF